MDELIRKQDAVDLFKKFQPYMAVKTFEFGKELEQLQSVEVVRCKDCIHFELNHWDGIIITAHEICNKWAGGCKTSKDGYCFLGERKTDDSQMQSDKSG